ncbi:MAG: hypothetical protein GC136_08645 [Alphaproteobacteria bacterium]|nr:hypothetical protein [Alphaproteobacteria bacterium]
MVAYISLSGIPIKAGHPPAVASGSGMKGYESPRVCIEGRFVRPFLLPKFCNDNCVKRGNHHG